jgi:cellulose synthase/poly-beta-1,6-N-acetylglucosamine synthase-like glycosyltransferase
VQEFGGSKQEYDSGKPNLHLNNVQSMRLDQMLTDDVCRRLGIFELPKDFRLSVVIPVFNEVKTVVEVIERVRRTGLPLEIILVDDGSQDGTREKLAALPNSDDLRIIMHPANRGKGAALRTGFLQLSCKTRTSNTTPMIFVF